ncbi:MoxR-like ATPase [Salana multivorans]|uniref:MoxR-like ATPase n=1 Tax=Salana multivorans TaxID=120377 RepID=A0A3N2D8V7_9MICO|nr:MoxR family ATPase [Salana multivorans]OJX97421.1 MAG: ATPase [Micrococcales bacterium 73-15]ROR96209.1 MoxR-like ATPase [Salana multivorans]
MSTLSQEQVAAFRLLHTDVVDAVSAAVQGKRSVVELTVTCLFAGGHVLLEDVPGTGKTTLARSIAAALGGTSRRIQFTPDLLPADITGTAVFEPGTGEITFRPGPVFTHVLLADEINRAAAKTQSALLEVMAERTVTVDGIGHRVPDPFLVIATQNPIDLDGTYRLPEAQLDRFLARVSLGYPDAEHEIEVLRPGSEAGVVEHVREVTTPARVAELTVALRGVHVADPLLAYVRAIGAATRQEERLRLGASTRALRGLIAAAQTFAASQGRHYVVPSDVQRLAEPVLAHRLIPTRDAVLAGEDTAAIVAEVVQGVEAPRPVPA